MTPDRALALAAYEIPVGNSIPPSLEQLAEAQLCLTAEILKELRALRQKINDDMPIEPVQVDVQKTVYTSSAP